jgi:hypothetical protein
MRDLNYEQLQKRIEEENRLYEAKTKILRKKREERKQIKRAGGGHEIAKKILMGKDTDFDYGANTSPESGVEIDRRIAEEAADRCMGRVACQVCKKFHGYCVEITEEKEKLKMLPTGEDGGNNRRGSGRQSGGLNFINNVDLTDQPQEAKILMVKFTEKGKQGPSITLKLAFKNEIRYLWVPCRKSDQRYTSMLNAFGANENNWVDERIILLLEKDEFSEGFRTAVRVPAETKKGGKK